MSDKPRKSKHSMALFVLAAGMFGFAFALVPLYNVFCEITGLNGKTSNVASVAEIARPGETRDVTIHLMAKVSRGLPWEVKPLDEQIRVRVGEKIKA